MNVTVAGRPAPLLYVSPDQINFEIPPGTPTGNVELTVQTGLGTTLNFSRNVTAAAPGLFTANGDGRGVVAASAIRVTAGSALQTTLPVFRCGDMPGSCVSVPIQLGIDTPIYVTLYGTAIRGAPSGRVAFSSMATPFLSFIPERNRNGTVSIRSTSSCRLRCAEPAKLTS